MATFAVGEIVKVKYEDDDGKQFWIPAIINGPLKEVAGLKGVSVYNVIYLQPPDYVKPLYYGYPPESIKKMSEKIENYDADKNVDIAAVLNEKFEADREVYKNLPKRGAERKSRRSKGSKGSRKSKRSRRSRLSRR